MTQRHRSHPTTRQRPAHPRSAVRRHRSPATDRPARDRPGPLRRGPRRWPATIRPARFCSAVQRQRRSPATDQPAQSRSGLQRRRPVHQHQPVLRCCCRWSATDYCPLASQSSSAEPPPANRQPPDHLQPRCRLRRNRQVWGWSWGTGWRSASGCRWTVLRELTAWVELGQSDARSSSSAPIPASALPVRRPSSPTIQQQQHQTRRQRPQNPRHHHPPAYQRPAQPASASTCPHHQSPQTSKPEKASHHPSAAESSD